MAVLIVANLFALVLEHVPALFEPNKALFHYFDIFSITVFVLEYALRLAGSRRPGLAADPATALFHAATVTGARSLGSTGGALEVGRPADFFTVNLFDPALAGSDAGSLLAHVVLALERRAVREVWIGARQRLVNGRHALHGPIVGRFVEGQQRVWAGGEAGPVVR